MPIHPDQAVRTLLSAAAHDGRDAAEHMTRAAAIARHAPAKEMALAEELREAAISVKRVTAALRRLGVDTAEVSEGPDVVVLTVQGSVR
jgi:hypothetical protein